LEAAFGTALVRRGEFWRNEANWDNSNDSKENVRPASAIDRHRDAALLEPRDPPVVDRIRFNVNSVNPRCKTRYKTRWTPISRPTSDAASIN
jgi:hypothetical protein